MSEKITEEDLKKQVKKCHYKTDCHGTPICRMMLFPCVPVLESGKCPMLVEFIEKAKKDGKI